MISEDSFSFPLDFQIFMKDSDYPIELSDLSSIPDRPTSGQCPPFVQAIPAEKVRGQDLCFLSLIESKNQKLS